MNIMSWNVNGLRAIMKKGFLEYFYKVSADIFCVQETKLQEGQIELDLDGYYQYWNYAHKKGYSGTAVFSKIPPIDVTYGLGITEHDQEGRVITLEFNDFWLVNVYTPNSQPELKRLNYRMEWEENFREFVKALDRQKPVIICGDLNVAHKEIDLKNPKNNRRNAGFTDEERTKMTKLQNSGFLDSFRYFYPELEGSYTFWSYMRKARERNSGWRLDYVLTTDRIKTWLKQAYIYSDIMGSDHCPVGLTLSS